MQSRFSKINQAKPIEVFAVLKSFTDDIDDKKVNLSVGAYRADDGRPWVLPIVKKVEMEMSHDNSLNHEYLPILGLESFTTAATRLLLGNDCPALQEGRAIGIQVISGTGGLRVTADFLSKILNYKNFYCSDPTWGNHKSIFQQAGFLEGKAYRYWNEETRGLDFDGMIEDLNNAVENSVIILHSCAHNPTGVDPTHEQWKKIADVIQLKRLFPLFDSAYQGFASGNLDDDAWAVRYFANSGFEMIATQSFAKNFGLYNERIGNMVVIVKDVSVIAPMRSQITLLVRGSYSNPPNHGARIVSRVLNDDNLFSEWKGCIEAMSKRIQEMRIGLRERLERLGTPGTWNHITNQIGMFSFTGLTAAQAKYLAEKCHIYLLSSGRINMCGINTKNIDYVAECFCNAIKNI